jgi:acyl-CoA hydrolase
MADYGTVANNERIEKVVAALQANDFQPEIVETLEDAKQAVLGKIPAGKKVFTGTSATLIATGLDEALNGAPYESVRDNFMKFYGQPDKALEMKQIGSAADVYVGSAHALTEDGKILIASASGSQIPALVYGAAEVILVVGAQKLAKDLADGVQRIEEHTVPLEDKRAQEAYGSGTNFSKLLVLNNGGGGAPNRFRVIIVKENVGY